MSIARGQDWGPDNTRQPCPCPHIRAGEAKDDDSGKCPRCKTARRTSDEN